MNAVLVPPKVQILDGTVVNQIAAGEVVERPASVVKELVENSLDASATTISVAITNGGKTSIDILDDGWGMTREDALLAIERFGTSKIECVDDLLRISSHGFRGEAIPSIASVSRFSLETYARGAVEGVEIQIEGGGAPTVRSKPLAPGTRIGVRQLFYNVPARKKFLRSESTEEGLIRSLLVDFAVGYPNVHFRFSSDGVERFIYPAGSDFFSRAKELRVAGDRPVTVSQKLVTAGGPVTVTALLSQPIECVAQAGRLRLLVNRRSVRDKLLLKAVRDGYAAYLRPGRYPMGVVALEVPPEDLDVNVHPQKTEVRFRRPEVIFQVIVSGIKKALAESGHTPLPHGGSSPGIFPGAYSPGAYGSSEGGAPSAQQLAAFGRPFEPQSVTVHFPGSGPAGAGAGSAGAIFHRAADGSIVAAGPGSSTFPADPSAGAAEGGFQIASGHSLPSVSAVSQMRFVGQLLACYLVFEGGETAAIVDMHAAHERVVFFRLKRQYRDGALLTQQLLIPELIECDDEAARLVEQHSGALQKLGFELDQMSETQLAIRMMPAALSGHSARAILQDLLSEPDFADWLSLLEQRIDAVLARMACHRSVRSGRILRDEEAHALIAELSEADASGLCPHGRPTVKFLPRLALESMFGRV